MGGRDRIARIATASSRDSRGSRASIALLGALLLATAPNDRARASEAAEIDRLRSWSMRHADDPDLLWALARRLARAGEADQALDATRRLVDRWPDRREGARVEIASTLLDAGRRDAALALLDEEVERHPDSAMAHFYRGLALRDGDRIAEANQAFAMAGRLEAGLRAEALLAQAVGHLELGEDGTAVELLQEILRIDPTGETALRARLLLRRREQLAVDPALRFDAYAGFQWDDNVTLESSENEVEASDRDDLRGIWGAGGSWRAWSGERTELSLGLRYDHSEHHRLDEFDVIGLTFFGSGTWRPSDRLAVRLDGIVWNTWQDLDTELTGATLRPNLLVSFGPRWGLLRLFGQVERLEYHDDPDLAQWDRDAMTYGAGVEQIVPLADRASWVALALSFQRNLTQADPGGGPDAFDGDFDHDRWRARLLGRFALPWSLAARIEASYSHDDYLNDNLAYFLSPSTLGETRRRTDDVIDARIALSRPIFDRLSLEVSWRGTRRISNVDRFDYDKQVIGLLARFTTN